MKKISKDEAIEKYGVRYESELTLPRSLFDRGRVSLEKQLKEYADMKVDTYVRIKQVLGLPHEYGSHSAEKEFTNTVKHKRQRFAVKAEKIGAFLNSAEVQGRLREAEAGKGESPAAFLENFLRAKQKMMLLQKIDDDSFSKNVRLLPEVLSVPDDILEPGSEVCILDLNIEDPTQSVIRENVRIEKMRLVEPFNVFARGEKADVEVDYHYSPFVPRKRAPGDERPYIKGAISTKDGNLGSVYGEEQYGVVSRVFDNVSSARKELLREVREFRKVHQAKVAAADKFILGGE